MATDIEHALLASKETNDLSMFLRLITQAALFVHIDKHRVDRAIRKDRLGEALHHRHWRNLRAQSPRDLTMFTRGALPERVDDVVACQVVPNSLWGGLGRKRDLVINPGTPSEVRITNANGIGSFLAKLRKDEPSTNSECGHVDQLVGHDDADIDAELLHGLGCGVHLAVHAAVPWNEVGDVYDGYIDDVEGLDESWDVTSSETWREQLANLLAGSNTGHDLESLFEARRRLDAFDPDGARTPEIWFAYADQATPLDESWIARVISAVAEYEERLTIDGVLQPGEMVPSVLGYDYGRAVPFARWGVGARFATFEEAREGIRIAGRNARAAYDSWRMFSAGYILGRALRFDDLEFGHMYTSAVGPHRLLMNTVDSPWRTIDFADPAF